MNTDEELFWYVFYTYPRSEKIAYKVLLQNKYEVFLPVRKELRIWKNRQRKINDGKPAIIRQKEIDGIKIMVGLNAGISVEPVFEENEKVKIISGPFADYEGIICVKKGRKRFGIQLKEINQAVFIEVDANILDKIS